MLLSCGVRSMSRSPKFHILKMVIDLMGKQNCVVEACSMFIETLGAIIILVLVSYIGQFGKVAKS